MEFKVGDKVHAKSDSMAVDHDGVVFEVYDDSVPYPYRVTVGPAFTPLFLESELTPISSLWKDGDKPNYPVAHVTARWVEATELDNAGWEPEVAYHELGSTDAGGNDTWFISHDGVGRHFYNSYADLENDIAAE